MSQITDIRGNTQNINCLSCAIVNGEVKNPGALLRTKFFDVHQDYEIPIPGFTIISSVRHIQSVDEFTEEERLEFIKILSTTRKGLREVLNINTVYLIQEEDTSAHFHTWLFPRYPWMEEKFGRKTSSLKPIMDYARQNLKTEENIKLIDNNIEKLKKYLLNHPELNGE